MAHALLCLKSLQRSWLHAKVVHIGVKFHQKLAAVHVRINSQSSGNCPKHTLLREMHIASWRNAACACTNLYFCLQVRDGRVTVTKAENGEGYTVTALDDASMAKLKEGKERTQVIIPLDMYDWEDFCTRMRPQDCLMSHRPPAIIPGAPRTPHTGVPGLPARKPLHSGP